VQALRARTAASLRGARNRLELAALDMDSTAREAAREVDSQLREHRWAAVGIAAGLGVLVGILLGRR
jgi:ElaB/YqjD/DUF883 family membrane-anchored ribosome-binding protein